MLTVNESLRFPFPRFWYFPTSFPKAVFEFHFSFDVLTLCFPPHKLLVKNDTFYQQQTNYPFIIMFLLSMINHYSNILLGGLYKIFPWRNLTFCYVSCTKYFFGGTSTFPSIYLISCKDLGGPQDSDRATCLS